MASILTTLLFQKNIFQGAKDELHESFKKQVDKHFRQGKKYSIHVEEQHNLTY